MKQEKAKTHKQYNGANTPIEHLNDDLGRMLVDELIFPYAAIQFNPRDTRRFGKKYDLRERYGGSGRT